MEVQTMDAVKILMVDDEERMRKLVKDFLTIKGYRVLEAGRLLISSLRKRISVS